MLRNTLMGLPCMYLLPLLYTCLHDCSYFLRPFHPCVFLASITLVSHYSNIHFNQYCAALRSISLNDTVKTNDVSSSYHTCLLALLYSFYNHEGKRREFLLQQMLKKKRDNFQFRFLGHLSRVLSCLLVS